MRGFVAQFAVAALAVAGIHAQTLDDGSMTGQCTVSNSVLQWEDDNFPGCGTLSYTYEGCCGNVLNASDDAVCRSAVVESAYCENTLITDGCDFTPNASDTVIFTVTTTYASAEESCCQQCKCYGDPLCLSFNGTFDEMIECDGRNLTTCQMEQDICREQYDHAGNRCKWLKGNDNYDWVSNLVSGSPCQADYNVSGQLEVNMIDVDDFSISALVGERGVITDAIIEISTVSGSFQLNSVDCFDNDPRDVGDSGAANAWTLPSGVSSLPSSWTVTTPNDVEIRWHIGDASVGIYADVICTKAMGATRSRLDIENVTDTQNRTTGDGFCFTGVIDKESQSGTNVGNIEGHYHCLAMQLPDVVTICKALTDDTCYERTLDGWQQYWCETAELEYTQASVSASTYEDMVATCLTEIRNGTEEEQASTWIQYACQMNSELAYSSNAQETYVEECVNEIEQFGWYEWEQKYEGIIVHQWTSSETCVTGIGNFTTIPDDETCAAGVMVEVYKNDEWTPILYFSPEQPPCDDADITASGEDFPDLFLYQIRLRQCGLSSSCLVAEGGTECKPTANMEVDMDFQGPSCSSSGESITTANNCTECSQNVFPSPQICDTTETWYMGECDQCCLTNNYSPGQEDQSCRDIETTQPFCDLNDTSMSDLCANLETESNNATVTLTITAPESGFDMECCESCALWGDPFGQAFDGSRQKLIICDARTSSCDFSESICDNLLDHAGNTCVWNQSVADEIGNRRANVGAYGSPCLPDWEESGEAEVVLYTVPEPLYNLSFFTGERSILTQLFLTTPRGSYSLDPEGCYGDDDYAGWTTISGDDISEALVMNYTGAGEDGYGEDERVWAVYEADMGIFFRVTCVNSQAVNSDYVGGYRLNIEHLIDTDINRTDTSGYCPTADLYQYGGQWTNNSNAVECQLKSLSDNLRACKAFWTGSCTPDQIDLGVESWCRTANQPYSVSKCVSNIYDSSDSTTTASQWTTAVCTALLPLKQSTDTDADFLRECEDLAETNGYYAIAENYGSVGERNFVNSYCASDISEYSTRDDTDACVMGISVQYESGDDEWEEVFFIPSNLLPCGNQLVIPAYESQYYPLFTNRIRLQQCDLDGSADACPAESNVEATCMSNFGFNVSLDFNYDAEGVGCTSGSS